MPRGAVLKFDEEIARDRAVLSRDVSLKEPFEKHFYALPSGVQVIFASSKNTKRVIREAAGHFRDLQK